MDLLKNDENAEVRLNVVNGFKKIATVVGSEFINNHVTVTLSSMINNGPWRVRMAVLELVAFLSLKFGLETYKKYFENIFMSYLTNNAASVRNMGVEQSKLLAQEFKNDWIVNNYLPEVNKLYHVDKKGYNYRMCCLESLAAVMPYRDKGQVS